MAVDMRMIFIRELRLYKLTKLDFS